MTSQSPDPLSVPEKNHFEKNADRLTDWQAVRRRGSRAPEISVELTAGFGHVILIAPLGAYSCSDLTVLDSPKVHVKLKRSSFSESRDNRGVPNLQFWSRGPQHAPLRDKLHISFIVLIGLKFCVKFERSMLNDSWDNRGSLIYNFGHVTLNTPPRGEFLRDFDSTRQS